MEIVLLFACLVVAMALAGDSLLGLLLVFATCQFFGALAWAVASSGRKHGRLGGN